MVLSNFPHVAAWIILYFAKSAADIFIAGVLLGIGVGLMESAVIVYIGELSQPSIRGTLLAISTMMGTLGATIMYLAGSVMNWRLLSLLCVSVPILAVCLLFLVSATKIQVVSVLTIDSI